MGGKSREDWELWEQVKKTITPSHPEQTGLTSKPQLEEPKKEKSHRSGRPSRLLKPKVPEPEIRINLAPKSATLDEAMGKKIAKGKVSIDGKIDLHGLTQDEAYSRLYQFIDAAFMNGKRTVLVITGKGKLGEGILRRAVPRWLAEPGFSDKVIGYREAHANQGGGGALYVRLRNKNRKRQQ